MSSIIANKRILEWLPYVKKWHNKCIVTVPPELVLSIIQLESAGNPLAKRAEPESLKNKQLNHQDSKINMIAKATGLAPLEVMTSYGLMQLLVTTAWGYLSAEHKNEMVTRALLNPDLNIRYGTAHLAVKLKMYSGDIRLAARDYNGSGAAAEAYGKNAEILCRQFAKMI